MDERYRSNEMSANEIVGTLSSNDITVLQESTYKDIHCLVSALSRSVTAALGEMSQHLHVLGADGTVTGEVPELQSLLQLQSVSKDIGYSCFRSSERSQNKCLIPSERPLLTSLYRVGAVEIVSENDAKSVIPFENVGSDSKLRAETFLQDVTRDGRRLCS